MADRVRTSLPTRARRRRPRPLHRRPARRLRDPGDGPQSVPGKTFLVVDGGMHHQMAASGRFGQVIRGNYPMSVANRMDADGSEVIPMVGCLCPPLDLLGDKVALPRRRGWRPDRALPGTAA